ncbi:NAD+ synthase [Mesoaciditoga lauensis]|uniref:NAD+ synthase n=1 Tax=Mesoaciditoga lauensis TaxID=1495039 RepID=UPI00055B0CDA|nr:NAD+ synthase [Mesoaciditoga lauensis]
MKSIRFSLVQKNFVVGGIEENKKKILSSIDEVQNLKPDFIVFPELSLVGYPPEDLLLKHTFIEDNIKALKEIAEYTRKYESVIVLGFVDRKDDIYNSAAVIQKGKIMGVYHKMLLPNYGVFDEKRYFSAGQKPLNLEYDGVKIGLSICEDIWIPDGPVMDEISDGAMIILNISSSPYHIQKGLNREEMLKVRASDSRAAVIYVNTVGGQDELVFDGHSLVIDEMGKIKSKGPDFEEAILTADIVIPNIVSANLHDPRRREMIRNPSGNSALITLDAIKNPERQEIELKNETHPPLQLEEEIFKALTLGVKDYVRKNGFKKVLIGLSGGMDSSLVAAVATEALGSENVVGVLMPSMYSSKSSITDAEELAKNLGIKTYTIPIKDVFDAYLKVLDPAFVGTNPDITEENLQARIRGNYLMALSNKFGWLVLTTGNKSEMSVGYATLYGDMAGGFAVIKDLYKTMVYKVASWYNSHKGKDVIPTNVFIKPPSAELRPDQVDQDSLPPYETLDAILDLYIERDLSLKEIIEMGFDEETVRKTIKMVDRNEYKRRQAPPGVKLTTRAFGRDRRLPITNHYR